jgi:acetylornithine deacetylase
MKQAAATEVLSKLVSIPSVSSMPNRPIIQYIENSLARPDWEIELYPYIDQAGTEKINLIATIGPKSEPIELALVCHTDTVPFKTSWTNAVNPEVSRGKLYGCGACDIKGFLACALAAISQLDASRLRRSLALVCTADEEVGCVGAKRIAAEKAIQPRYAIVGEPTDLHPVVAGKGYALAAVTVKGRTAHSAFPSEGRSAIYDALVCFSGSRRSPRKSPATGTRSLIRRLLRSMLESFRVAQQKILCRANAGCCWNGGLFPDRNRAWLPILWKRNCGH